jgi:hypothetical protein
VPNEETGAGIGATDEPNTLEPEEDPDAGGLTPLEPDALDDPTN